MSEIVGGKWALLIGINHYPKGPTPRLDIEDRPIEYNNLNGCVQDILEVEQFLLEIMKVEESHIIKLLAPIPEDDGLCECANRDEDKPTYKNITNALNSIINLAKPGDMVYIHYSGHGARATTIFPKLKSGTEWDEAFVPTDVACGGQYLRDLEIALFLKRMVDKNLVITVILDCCHSGGAVRNAGRETVRAVKGYYKSVLPEDLPDSFGEIERNGSLMLREPEGFTLFAACLPQERAREVMFDDGRVHGVFTHCLLQTLRHGLSQMPSSRALYQRVCGRVRDEFVDQTPFFAGEIDRLFFSAHVIAQINTISVRRISSFQRVGDELDLAGGTSHGVHIGSEYAVYPFGARISGTGAMRVVVKEVLSLISIATIVELSDANIGNIEPGCPAVLLKLPFEEKFQVTFFSREAATMEKFARDWEIHKGNDGWLQLVTGTENHALSSFHVTTNDRGEYEIGDGYGIPLPNIAPPLPFLLAGEPTAMPKLIGRIRHLAQFSAVKKIDNPDGTSNLRGSLSLELSRVPGVSSTQHEEAGAEYRVRNTERINLYVGNHGSETVYFALFNLAPLFSISQIYPARADFECLEPGQKRTIQLRMGIPSQLMQHVPQPVSVLDILKVFVTLEPASFRSLELPAIDSAELRGFRGGTDTQNGLQRLLHKLACPRRNATYAADIGDWQMMEVRVRVG